jgi:anti-sigma regulatory factor (Ser/Thr protein kinase)
LRASRASPEAPGDSRGAPAPVSRLLHLPAEPAALVNARQYISEEALACGLDGTDHYQFVYAFNEALTNAIKHGVPDGLGMITVSVAYDSDALTVTVYDPGRANTVQTRAPEGEGGRGLGLMLAMTDALNIQSDESGTTVSLSKRLPGGLRASAEPQSARSAAQ